MHPDYGMDTSAYEIARCRALAYTLGVADAIGWETRLLPDAQSLALLEPAICW